MREVFKTEKEKQIMKTRELISKISTQDIYITTVFL